MSILIAIIFGAVQGLTEFLPVSSSGHLTLLSKIFGIQNDTFLINILLHFATLFAVIYVFRKYIWEMIKHPLSKQAVKLYIASIPTILMVLFFKYFLNDYFGNSKLLPFGFLITAAILFFTYLMIGNKKEDSKEVSINKKTAFFMGIAQGFAIFPGISRSGITICTGLLSGGKREETARFSFLMSIPIIIASVVYEMFSGGMATISEASLIVPLLFSFITAFIVGILSIKFMLRIIKNAKYYWFSMYLFVIAILSFFVV